MNKPQPRTDRGLSASFYIFVGIVALVMFLGILMLVSNSSADNSASFIPTCDTERGVGIWRASNRHDAPAVRMTDDEYRDVCPGGE